MTDPATGWFEIKETTIRSSDIAANMAYQDEYGIKFKPITTRNPQANYIVERAHQTIGNLLHSFKLGSCNNA
eukprot:11244480-Ditylum_brightwellii.AAC.1